MRDKKEESMRKELIVGIVWYLAAGVISPIVRPVSALAADNNWIAGSGLWDTGSNWSLAVMPDTDDRALITPAGSGDIVIQYQNSSNPVLQLFRLDALGTGTLELRQSQDTLTVFDGQIGYSAGAGIYGTGTYTQSGGSLIVQNRLTLGYSGNSTGRSLGTYNLGGTGDLQVKQVELGLYGEGRLNQTGGTSTIASLFLGAYETGTGRYALSGGKLSVSNIFGVGGGYQGTGLFLQDGGENSAKSLYIGYGNESSGSYELNNGELISQNTYVGHNGTGTFTQRGGTHTVSNSLNVRSNSSYELSGGTLDVKNENIFNSFVHKDGEHSVSGTMYLGPASGNFGTYDFQNGILNTTTELLRNGKFNQSAGEHTVGSLVVGYDGFGEYTLSGGTLTHTEATEVIGYRSTGVFNQTGGTHTVNTLKIGDSNAPSQGSGTYNFDAGILDVKNIILGYAGGIGTFNQNGNTSLDIDSLDLGTYGWGSGQGNYNLTGGTLSAIDEKIGVYERGIFTQSGGTNTISNNLYIGQFTSNDPSQYAGKGDYFLENGNLAVRGNEFIGYHGEFGGFQQKNGSHAVSGSLYVGYGAGTLGMFDMIGGELNAQDLRIAYMGRGQFEQRGGMVTVFNLITIGTAGTGNTMGLYNLINGKVEAENLAIEKRGSFTQYGGENAVNQHLTINGSYTLLGGTLTAASAINNGVFDHSGGTADIGRMDNLGYLSGTGAWTGDIFNSGWMAPGSSPGFFEIDGDFISQGGRSTLLIDLGGTTKGIDYDVLRVTGAVTLSGALRVQWWDGFTASSGDEFDIFDWIDPQGIFTSIDLPFLDQGLFWDTGNLYSDGTLRVYGQSPAVPVPASIILFATGLAATAGLRVRSRVRS